VDVLLIDEISMVNAKLLEIVDIVARVYRNNHSKPFGGIKVIYIGDYLQLAPVPVTYVKEDASCHSEHRAQFCFELDKYWSADLRKNTFQLSVQHRQTDTDFKQALDEARRGNLSDDSLSLLKTRYFSGRVQ
jgi:ATP-dependent DNA helicase PIF1